MYGYKNAISLLFFLLAALCEGEHCRAGKTNMGNQTTHARCLPGWVPSMHNMLVKTKCGHYNTDFSISTWQPVPRLLGLNVLARYSHGQQKNRMPHGTRFSKTNYLKTDLLKQIKKYLQPDCVRNILFVSIAKLLHLNKLRPLQNS